MDGDLLYRPWSTRCFLFWIGDVHFQLYLLQDDASPPTMKVTKKLFIVLSTTFCQIWRSWNLLTYTCDGIHPVRVEPTSPRQGDFSLVGSAPRSPVTAALHLLSLYIKPSLSGLKAPGHPLFTPFHLVLIQVTRRGNSRDMRLIGRGVLTTPPFGPFCRAVGAQPYWHTDPLTPNKHDPELIFSKA